MKLKRQYWVGLLGLVMMAGCSGSSDTAGTTTDTQTLTGSVSTTSGDLSARGVYAAVEDCLADTVIATDTTGDAISAEVDADCAFEIDLVVGKSYVISLVDDGAFVATLIMDSGITGFTSSTLPITSLEGVLDLGIITISGTLATPTNNPFEEIDQDGDGQADLFDDDDDGDGTDDEAEEDCDLDGAVDDVDESDDDDDCAAASSDDDAKVLEVKPRNDPQTDEGNDTVDLDKEVKARTSCEIDQSSVTDETFSIVSESGDDVMACTFEFSDQGTGTTIKCKHEAQDFLPDTVYTATIEGVLCSDGRTVATKSWSWKTESSDDDDGDSEDDLDDADEAEGEDVDSDGDGVDDDDDSDGSDDSDDDSDDSGDDDSDDSDDDSSGDDD